MQIHRIKQEALVHFNASLGNFNKTPRHLENVMQLRTRANSRHPWELEALKRTRGTQENSRLKMTDNGIRVNADLITKVTDDLRCQLELLVNKSLPLAF